MRPRRLASEELSELARLMVYENRKLKDVLPERHPYAEISIIRAHDTISKDSSTHSAFFDPRKADAMLKKAEARNENERYRMIGGTIAGLESGRIICPFTDKRFDSDKVYFCLSKALREVDPIPGLE